MKPEEKIANVLKNIVNERKISSNPSLVEFKFNDIVVGAGIVVGGDERKILLKLNTEKIVKLKISEDSDAIYRYGDKLERYIFKVPFIMVEILDEFESYYKKYKKYSRVNTGRDYWNYINPFWLFWSFINNIFKVFIKHWIIASTIVAGLIVTYLSHIFGWK